MKSLRVGCLRLAALVLLASPGPSGTDAIPADLAAYVPREALAYVELPGLASLAQQGLDHPFARAVLASQLGQVLSAGKGGTPAQRLKLLEAVLGFPPLERLAQLGSDGLALALGPGNGQEPRWLLVLRGRDATVLEETLARALTLVAARAGHPGAFDEPAETIGAAELWRIGDDLSLARAGAVFLASNDERVLRASLALAGRDDAAGLAAEPRFRAAADARSRATFAFLWADLAAIDAQAGGAEKLLPLRRLAAEPAAQLLLGPGLCALGRAGTLTLGVALEGEDIALELGAREIELGPAIQLKPRPSPAPRGFRPHARDVANALLWRDAATVFAARVELFPPEQLPGLAKAVSDLALLFGGLRIDDEVLPGLSPWARLVVRAVERPARETPEIALPAAALVVATLDDDKTGFCLESGFQTAIGLTNVDRAQKGLDPLLLALEQVGDVSLTFARFRVPAGDDSPLDVRYNLVPACARVGRTFVVGTHRALVAELVRELADDGPQDTSDPRHEGLRLRGAAVEQLVDANAEAMIANAVLTEGKTRAKAEADIRGLAGVLDLVRELSLEVEWPEDSGESGHSVVVLRARLDLAEP